MYTPEQEEGFLSQSHKLLADDITIENLELLRDVIRYHEWKYSVQNIPVLGDFEFDQLFKKLAEFEKSNPESLTPDSPTQRVTTDLTSNLPTVAHIVPMLSLDNSYNGEDLTKFDESIKKLVGIEKNKDVEYCLEPKFDGGSIALLYEGDYLTRGATRGNGTRGEEMTANARAMSSVPLKVNFTNSNIHIAEIRGEAVIRKSKFDEMNRIREADGKELYANPRNTAAGGLRTKNPKETRDRHIEAFAFQLGHAVDADGNDVLQHISKHSDQIALLGSLGFKIPALDELVCKNIAEVIDKVQKWEERREEYPYEIDGMVVKVNERRLQEICGSTQHHPRWAIAFKFKAKQAITILENVEYQVGKIGSITPVAKVKPVHLAGVTVSSISLHNEEFILSKDLRLGDKVIVERAGDVIPYIVGPLKDQRNGSENEITFPTICPINTTDRNIDLIKEDGVAAWRCPNCLCGAQDLQKIIFHVSKPAMDIDGFGQRYVELFHELGWINDISDVYNLNYNEMAALEGFGKKSADNLEAAINQARQNPISRLLHSLTIHHLGKRASKLIAERIDHVLDLINWQEDDFTNIKDIGPVVAKNVAAYFADEKNTDMLRRMEERGVNLYQTEEDKPLEVAEDAPLLGKTILFTGSFQQMKRNDAKKIAELAGAKNISAVSSNLDILVVGEKAGSKLSKAEALGTVQIWTEEEFIKITNG